MKWVLIKLIKLYQVTPTHVHTYCRFTPTCSEYFITALEEYGFFKGTRMGIKRIISCHPFGKKGYDPVKKKEKK